MGWCPKCKSEYENHIKKCKECDIELVEVLENDQECTFFEESKKLINVANIHEANIIVSLLAGYNIPAFYKSKESGEYLQIYSGFNFYGFDIHVPSSLINEAKDVISQYHEEIDLDNELDVEYEEVKELDMKIGNRNRLVVYILGFILIALPIILLIIFGIIDRIL